MSWRRYLRRDRSVRDRSEELSSYLEIETDDNLARGMGPKQARLAAQKKLGNRTRILEEIYWMNTLTFLDSIARDLRYAMRGLIRNPGFAAVAVLTLGLGIGANTAIFSLLDASLLRKLPFPEPAELMVFQTPRLDRPGSQNTASSPADYLEWQRRAQSFSSIGASNFGMGTIGFSEDGTPAERISIARFTASMWDVLNVKPLLGHVLRQTNGDRDPERAAILSYDFWQRRYGGDPGILGKRIRMDGQNLSVIGVMPEEFVFYQPDTAVWVPLAFTEQERGSTATTLLTVGRLRPEVSAERAQAEMDSISAGLAEESPDRVNVVVRLKDLHETILGDLGQSLLLLQWAVAFVLLIACANVAGLLLARSGARGAEMAIRSSLGSSRGRIVRQLLTESLLLSVAGGLVGLGIAWVGSRTLVGLSPAGMLDDAGLDTRVLWFTALLTMVTGVVFGLAPALRASRVDLSTSLKESGRANQSGKRWKLRSALVAVQLGLALSLLIGAGLMVRGFLNVQRVPLGIDPSNVLTFDFSVPRGELMRETDADYHGLGLAEISPVVGQTYERVWERIRAIPGVVSAAGVSARAPVDGGGYMMGFFIEGQPRPDTERAQDRAAYLGVTPDYFETMRIPLVRGRDFSSSDAAAALQVVIISEAMAKQYWPDKDPIGQRITFDLVPGEQPHEIVGVVGDTMLQRFQHEASPIVYVPQLQEQSTWPAPGWQFRASMAFVLRTEGDPMALVPALREAVAEIDPNKPVANPRTVEQYLGDQSRAIRLYTLLLTVFGISAAVLAAIGIYGVMAYTVAWRTREIGIRMALGATGSTVMRLVLRRAVVLTFAGVAMGVGAALGLTRFLQSLLYYVSTTDAATFAVTTIGLVLVGVLASVVPAWRAMRVDPARVLHAE